MKARTGGALLLGTLILSSCGGGSGSDTTTCSSGISGLCTMLGSTSPTQGGTTTPLFTTAPTEITLPFGSTAVYAIGGGQPPYIASTGNSSVVVATVAGTTLKIDTPWQQSVSSPPTPVSIVDATGQRVTTNITVLGKQENSAAPSILPSAITVSDCTTNIPFIFTGGTPPFTVYTGNNSDVPVSAALPFGPDYYFTADVHTTPASFPNITTFPYPVTLTVLDSHGRIATATLSIESHSNCPNDNPRLEVQAGSVTAKVSEKIRFYVSGGKPDYNAIAINQTNAKDPIAIASNVTLGTDGRYYFDVTALSTGGTSSTTGLPLLTGASLITVTSGDGQKKNVVLTVFPQP